MKPCPFCAEDIRFEAVKCRFCGEFLYGSDHPRCATKHGTRYEGMQAEDVERKPEIDGPGEDLFEEDDIGEQAEQGLEEEDQDIEQGDELLYSGRPSIFALTYTIIGAVITVAICAVIWYYPVLEWVSQYQELPVETVQIPVYERRMDQASIVFGALVVVLCLGKIASLKSMRYEVTPDRIEWCRGLLTRQVDNIDMYRVIDLKLRRTFLDCLVGVGTVTITTKDESDPVFDFYKVHHCRYLYNLIKKAGLKADQKHNVIHVE